MVNLLIILILKVICQMSKQLQNCIYDIDISAPLPSSSVTSPTTGPLGLQTPALPEPPAPPTPPAPPAPRKRTASDVSPALAMAQTKAIMQDALIKALKTILAKELVPVIEGNYIYFSFVGL
jgi:hypothetical protein